MSTQSIESILSRAMSDAAFADLLFSDPERALAGYDLTADEAAGFKAMSRADFAAAPALEERKSFGISSKPNHNESALRVRR